MNKFKKAKILAIVVSLVILFHGQYRLLADEVSPWSPQFFSYRFHLYYDNGQLFANRDFNFKYDIISDNFIPEVISTTDSFRGEIISGKDEVLDSFRFDPQKGNSAFKKGSIAVDGPYFANAVKVNFYNGANQLLLALDVSGSSFCNDDGTCNSDVGENYQNCPNDCPKPSPSPTTTPSPSFFGFGLLKLILILAGGVLAAVVIWIVWGIIKKRKTGSNAPNELPPAPPSSVTQ